MTHEQGEVCHGMDTSYSSLKFICDITSQGQSRNYKELVNCIHWWTWNSLRQNHVAPHATEGSDQSWYGISEGKGATETSVRILVGSGKQYFLGSFKEAFGRYQLENSMPADAPACNGSYMAVLGIPCCHMMKRIVAYGKNNYRWQISALVTATISSCTGWCRTQRNIQEYHEQDCEKSRKSCFTSATHFSKDSTGNFRRR